MIALSRSRVEQSSDETRATRRRRERSRIGWARVAVFTATALLLLLGSGEAMAKDLVYSPLPPEVLTKAEAKVKSINHGGKPFIS